MKNFLLAAFCVLFICPLLFSQSDPNYIYLSANFYINTDKVNKKEYFSINPERGNPHAETIYQLREYKPKQKHNMNAAPDSAENSNLEPGFNYFTNVSEALNFLDRQGWQLFTIINMVSTDRFKDVQSKPVYYFRKRITPVL